MFRRMRGRVFRRGLRRGLRLAAGRRFRRRRFLVGEMTMLLVGGAAYKLAAAEIDRILMHTGQSPEDLARPDLEAALDDLDIEDRPMSDADRAAIEAEATDTASWAPTSEPAATGSPTFDTDLEKLASLRDRGLITELEFQEKKKQILGL